MKEYVLFAGVNGAGKSTLYRTMDVHYKDMPRINMDEIVRTFGDWRNSNDVMKAGIIRNIHKAKKLGYCVNLHYVGVETVEIAKERIAQRVLDGGHGIPDKDVERRYKESFQKLEEVLPLCNNVVLYDNTRTFVRIAAYQDGNLVWAKEKLPVWYQNVVGL